MTSSAPESLIAGRYRLDGLLGAGGMGEVHRAFDTVLHRSVALKLLRSAPTNGAEFVQRALREGRAAAALNHPNVVAIHDMGEHEGAPFLVMELVEGVTLRSAIHGALPPIDHRIRWLLDIARALASAHRASIIHRDVKPENVLVRSADGVAKVADFGIARSAVSHPHGALARITVEGQIVGTLAYMAPEQIRDEPLDARADVFAWGVTAFELLAGRLPWLAVSSGALVAAVLTEAAPALDTVTLGIHASIAALVARSLEKSREHRLLSMDEAVDLLSPFVSTSEPHSVNSQSEVGRAVTEAAVATPISAGLAANGPLRSIDARVPASGVPAAIEAYRAGVAWQHDGNWVAADAEFLRATALDPELGSAFLRLALTGRATTARSPAEVRAHFRRALQLRGRLPDRDRALLRALEPIFLLDRPDWGEASRRFVNVCVEYSFDAELQVHGGWVNSNFDVEASLRLSRRAAELDPGYADSLQGCGLALANLGRLDEADRTFARAIELSPAGADLYWDRALLAAGRGDGTATEANARQSVAIDPMGSLFDLLAGAIYARGGRQESIREVLRARSAALSPAERALRSAQAEVELALTYGRFQAAARAAIQWIDAARPTAVIDFSGPAFAFAIQIALERGEQAIAAELCRTYLGARELWSLAGIDATDPITLSIATLLELGAIGESEAQREINSVLSANGDRIGIVWARAHAPLLAGAPSEQALERARATMPPHDRFWFHRQPMLRADAGICFLRLGDRARATGLLRAASVTCLAVTEPIRSTHAHLWLGEALEAEGDVQGARAAYQVVVDRWGAAGSSRSAKLAQTRMNALAGPT